MKDLSKLTDDQLVGCYLEGNDNAFDEILCRYKNEVYSYIYYQLNDEDIANDIFQETFVKVILSLQQGRYTESGRLGAWISRIARNLVVDHFRRSQTLSELSNDSVDYDLYSLADIEDESREEQLLRQQALAEVRILMESLPEDQRKVVYMRYYQEMSFQEIADAVGCGINTALGRMHYALQNMRKMAIRRDMVQ